MTAEPKQEWRKVPAEAIQPAPFTHLNRTAR